MRCFISIDLPEEVQKKLAIIQAQLPEGKFNLVKPENIHLTIKFLGEVDENKIDEVRYVINKIKFEKFQAKLSAIGSFSPQFIRVVWVGIEPSDKIKEIHDKIDEELKQIGFEKDKRWETHATIARVKWVKDKKKFIEELNKIKINNIEFTVDKIMLKKSTLTKQGPIYEDL